MKKIISVVLLCLFTIAIFMGFTAWGFTASNKVDDHEVVSLVWKEPTEEYKYYDNSLETTAGITFSCSDNYVIGPGDGGQFAFALKEITEEVSNKDFDYTVEIFCSHKIIKIECYSYDYKLIASKELSNSYSVAIGLQYSRIYCDYVVLYIRGDDGNTYTAKFTRFST